MFLGRNGWNWGGTCGSPEFHLWSPTQTFQHPSDPALAERMFAVGEHTHLGWERHIWAHLCPAGTELSHYSPSQTLLNLLSLLWSRQEQKGALEMHSVLWASRVKSQASRGTARSELGCISPGLSWQTLARKVLHQGRHCSPSEHLCILARLENIFWIKPRHKKASCLLHRLTWPNLFSTCKHSPFLVNPTSKNNFALILLQWIQSLINLLEILLI